MAVLRKANFHSVDNCRFKYFVMIVHDFSLPAKQVRIDTYNFRLRVPQFETVFFFNLRLLMVADVTKIVSR